MPNGTSDLTFKTYVAPPLPSTPTPSGGAAEAPKRHCKHKKKHKSGAVIAKNCKKKK